MKIHIFSRTFIEGILVKFHKSKNNRSIESLKLCIDTRKTTIYKRFKLVINLKNTDICLMKIDKNFFLRNKAAILYSVSLAFLLFLLKWLEIRFIIFDHSFEIYIGFIAVIFTALGIWLSLKLSRPRIETVVVEKEVYVNGLTDFVQNTQLITQLELSKRELEILGLLAEGYSNQEIAEKLFVSLSTVKTHNQNLFEKLEVKRRIQAVEKAKKLSIIP